MAVGRWLGLVFQHSVIRQQSRSINDMRLSPVMDGRCPCMTRLITILSFTTSWNGISLVMTYSIVECHLQKPVRSKRTSYAIHPSAHISTLTVRGSSFRSSGAAQRRVNSLPVRVMLLVEEQNVASSRVAGSRLSPTRSGSASWSASVRRRAEPKSVINARHFEFTSILTCI